MLRHELLNKNMHVLGSAEVLLLETKHWYCWQARGLEIYH